MVYNIFNTNIFYALCDGVETKHESVCQRGKAPMRLTEELRQVPSSRGTERVNNRKTEAF